MITEIGEFLAGAKQIYLFVAVVGSAIFIIQFIMSIARLGGDHSADYSGDSGDIGGGHDHGHGFDALKLFTFRGVVTFLTFFGWSGYFWGEKGWSGFFISSGCGITMMFLTALAIFVLLKLQQSGNLDKQDFIGCTGVVYLGIPSERASGGRITVTLPDCTRNVAAISDIELKTGTPIKITGALDGNIFVVEKLN